MLCTPSMVAGWLDSVCGDVRTVTSPFRPAGELRDATAAQCLVTVLCGDDRRARAARYRLYDLAQAYFAEDIEARVADIMKEQR
jgi:hypothetical protein